MTRKDQKIAKMKKVRQTLKHREAVAKARAIRTFLNQLSKVKIPDVPQKESITRTLEVIRIAVEAQKNA